MPDTSFLIPLLLQGVLAPFAAAAIAALALRRAVGGPAATALAVAAGFLTSYAATVQGAWSLSPQSAMDWQPWVVLAAVGGALLVDRAPAGVRLFLARAVLGVLLSFVVVWPAIGSLGAVKASTAAVVAGIVIAAAWSVRTRGLFAGDTHPLQLAIIAGGAGLAMMLDSSQTPGRLAGALAVALAACAVIGRFRTPAGSAAVGTTLLVLGSLLLQAQVYAGFPLVYVALLAAATVADIAPALLARRGRSANTWRAKAASIALTLVPVAVVVGLAVKGMQDSGGY
jgi:hypothetical protein